MRILGWAAIILASLFVTWLCVNSDSVIDAIKTIALSATVTITVLVGLLVPDGDL